MELDRRGAEPLLWVLTEREEANSVAIASNESFSGWTKTVTDPRLCAAIVDRLTFGGNIIETSTVSCRFARAGQAGWTTGQSLRLLLVQEATEHHDLTVLIAERLVERDHAVVRRTHHEQNLRDPSLPHPLLTGLHRLPSQALALLGVLDRQVVHPPPVAVMADHRRPEQSFLPVAGRQHRGGRA